MAITNIISKCGRVLAVAGLAGITSAGAYAAEYTQGEIIVKYKQSAIRTRESMNFLYDSVAASKVRRTGMAENFEQVVLGENVRVEDAVAQFRQNEMVEYAQPNYILHAYPTYKKPKKPKHPPKGDPGGIPCPIPGIPFPPGCQDPGNGQPGNPDPGNPDPGNPTPPVASRPALQPAPADVDPPVADPDLNKAYGIAKIGAVEAWKTFRGSKDFIVADIDTGIDYNHEDLAFNIWRNPHPSSKQDIVGYDFIHDDGLPFDDNEHGTHTAGTIGAVGGNGKGVSGVAQRVSLMSVKFLTGEGSGTTADAIRAIDYAVANGAKVLSNSWGGPGDENNQALQDAVDRARQKGVLFIAAAGNDGANDDTSPSYPAAFTNDNMITVAATDDKDGLAFFSNYGAKTVHVGAPGTGVYSTVPGNKYTSLDGTSMACPHVAGAVALVWAAHPEWDYKKVKQVILDTVDKLPVLAGKTVSGGRINVLQALRSN